MYPCISYKTAWNDTSACCGRMEAEVYCTNENEISPEFLAESMVKALSGMFLLKSSDMLFLLRWNYSDSFEVERKEPVISGVKVVFDMLRIPLQEEFLPCPVWSVNHYIKRYFQQCILIGYDALPSSFRATTKHPLVYVKKVEENHIRTSYAMAWMGIEINISVFCTNFEETEQWTSAMMQSFSIEKETCMKNGSPLLISDINRNMSHNPLEKGQITIIGEYGVMRKEEEKIKLNHAIFENSGNP